MFNYYLQGIVLGLAYVAPIGMQNLYVINTALSRKRLRAYQVAFITSFFDISLAVACFWGIGTIMEKFQILKSIILLVGSVLVLYIGLNLIFSKSESQNKMDLDISLLEVIMTCFLVTWANPQAIIDGSLLLGSFRLSLPKEASTLFILGVCTASLSWFTGITIILSSLNFKLNNKLLRIINIICGVIIVYYGLRLGINFLKAIK